MKEWEYGKCPRLAPMGDGRVAAAAMHKYLGTKNDERTDEFLLYELYGLTEEEVKVVEGDS